MIHYVMVRIRRGITASLILTRQPGADKFRGFCLLISGKYNVGISAKKSARMLYLALFLLELSEIYKLYWAEM